MKIKAITAVTTVDNQPMSFEYKSENDITATLKLWNPPNDNQSNKIFDARCDGWVAALAGVYQLTRNAELVGSLLPAIEQDRLRYQQQAIFDLTTALTKLEDAATRQVERQAEFLSRKSAELDEQQREKDEQRRKEHESKLTDVAAERALLTKERAEIDMRKSTIARRALLTDLRTVIGADFKVTGDTAKIRKTNHGLCIAGILLGLALIGIGAWKLLGTEQLDWHHWSMFVAGTILFSSTLIYYLRWNHAWFNQLAEAEFASRKLGIDVLRSSWVAEMALEWNEEKVGKEFPKELLTAFTSDLFKPATLTDAEYHPVGQLVNALGRIQNVKIDKDGVELSRKAK